MYSLTIHFGPNAIQWQFLFKEKEKAENAVRDFSNPAELTIIDDFGQHASIGREQIHGILLEDLDLVEEARILRSLSHARGEVKARQRALTDPVIRTANTGAPVLTPMGGFRQ